MKYSIIIVFSFIISIQSIYSQFHTIIEDNFADSSKFIDNSKTWIWGKNKQPYSCYEIREKGDPKLLTFNCLTYKQEALKYANYHAIPDSSTKATACVDWVFPTFYRENDTLKIEFDILFDKLSNSGEVSRVNCILLHEYPYGGAKFGEVDSLNKYHPYGRPAYHFRMKPVNAAGVNYSGFVGYGGNDDINGKLYIHYDGGGVARFWLPGAVPLPDGISGYPSGSFIQATTPVLAATNSWEAVWKHITWIVYPDRYELWHRMSKDNASLDVLAYTFQTPLTWPTPPKNYRYFEKIDAFRIYRNHQGENTYLANVKISRTQHQTPKIDFNVCKQTESEGNSGSKTFPVYVSVSPKPQNPVTVDIDILYNSTNADGADFVLSVNQLTFTATQSTQSIGIIVYGDSNLEANETIFLKLKNATTGASIGTRDTFLMTIRNDEISSVDIKSSIQNDFQIYPNPCSDFLHIECMQEKFTFDIYTVEGQKIESFENCKNISKTDVSQLKKGIYFLRLTTEDKVYYQKIVKD